MSAPPWVFAVIISMINAWHADYTQDKFYHIAWPMVMGVIGFIITIATTNKWARYFSLFLQAGSYAGFIVFYSWISSSFPRPPAKRAVAIALVNAFSQLGNVAGSYVWSLTMDEFRRAYGLVLAMFVVALFGCFCFKMVLVRENKKLDKLEDEIERAEEARGKDGITTEHIDSAGTVLPRKGFRYLV